MKNKAQILMATKVLLAVAFICILIFTFTSNMTKEDINFDDTYAKIEELLNQQPQKTNSYKDQMIFYKPKGYKFMDESYIMTKNEMYIEIIPEKIDVNSEKYFINKDKELVFEKKSSQSSAINMLVWEEGRYDVLITKQDGYAVAGNFNKKDLEQGIIDMAKVLNTLKLKEIN